jgi:hypothetical protein
MHLLYGDIFALYKFKFNNQSINQSINHSIKCSCGLAVSDACPEGLTHTTCTSGACTTDTSCAPHGQICCCDAHGAGTCTHPDGTDHPGPGK